MENKSFKIIIMLLTLIILNTLLVGCWNYREVNDFYIVSGAAIDIDNETKELILTVEAINQGSQGTKMEPLIFENRGETFFQGIRSIISNSGKKLYWGHSMVIIVSEDIAKENIIPILDFFYRDGEVRNDMYIVISKEKTAKEIILETPKKANEIKTMDLLDELDRKVTYQYYSNPLWKFVKTTYNGYISSTFPTVFLVPNDGVRGSKLSGTAVFKGGKMIGWLDEIETRSYLWVIDEVRGGLVVKSGLKEKDQIISLDIKQSNTKVTPIYDSEKLSMNIEIKTNLIVEEIGCTENFLTKENIKILETDTEKKIKGDIEALLKKVQKEYNSDILDFGRIVKAKEPALWESIRSNWDEVFRNLDVEIEVDADIIGSSLSNKPLKIME